MGQVFVQWNEGVTKYFRPELLTNFGGGSNRVIDLFFSSTESQPGYTPGVDTRPVLRIFISSTAVDLTSYREHVRDAVLRLENLPIQMETFSAMSGQPVAECTRMAAEADAVVCIVAHRYGYVPPIELGGDGERSITWLEVDAAKGAGRPVFSFLVDPQAPWTAVKEQDRLIGEPEKAADIFKSVQKLEEFKKHLSARTTRQLFSDPNQLDAQVTAALSNFRPQATSLTTRVWKPLVCHALQPAPHFRGRAAILNELKKWLVSPVTPDRVLSLVAAGGTGKTALVNEAFHGVEFTGKAGVFVWSFYEDARTDNFLRAAYQYFTGRDDAPTGGALERLQMVLAGDAPHVLILDGLERVQTDEGLRRRGELEDQQLKRFVKGLAGGIGNARVLVTSRYPLVDLDDFKGTGHRVVMLDDLDRDNALAVLRGWGLKEDDAELAHIIEPLNVQGSYHALSVAALGSYLGNFDGPMPEFSLADAKESDPKASRLSRILEQYAKALTPTERDLLARLSLFPRGVKVELLGWIVQSGGQVAGALVGMSDHKLLMNLERLKKLGLVFAYGSGQGLVYSAHPFLRDSFRNLLAAPPEAVHESVRARLAPSLEERPRELSRDPAILDQYELLIEETLLAGRVQEAFDLYWEGLGNIAHLRSLGEVARGLRILERFAPQDDFSGAASLLSQVDQSVLATDLGLLAMYAGDLLRARKAHSYSLEIDRQVSHAKNQSINYGNLAEIELNAGNFLVASEYSQRAVILLGQDADARRISFRAYSLAALGEMEEAADQFKRASEAEGRALYSIDAVMEAEFNALRGLQDEAISQTENNREVAIEWGWGQDVCRCDALLARLIKDDLVRASRHLADARAFASRSGAVELQLRCFHSACELQHSLGDHTQSISEAEAGVLLADTCGLGKYSIDLRLALAESLLAAGEPTKALQYARAALDRSQAPGCRYAWGQADGLHLCGVAHLRLGERELARQRLTAALELRQRLGHPRIDETRTALESLR
jgi:tetratricopeptide (TPR) repeat protein